MSQELQELEKKWRGEKKLKAATIGFYHQGCQTSISTEKFPHISLEQVSPVVYFKRKADHLDYSLIWNVRAEKASELEEYLSYIKKRHDTKQLSVLEKSEKEALILLRFLSPGSSYEHVLESGVIPTSPVVGQQGFETYQIISPDPKGITKLARELSTIGDVKIMRVGDYHCEQSTPNLTHKQKEALQVALINGYYAWPRHTGLEQLAQVAHISRRSMQERLRRAEAKLFPKTVQEYLNGKS